MVVANNLQCDASIELKVLHSDKANVYVQKEVYKQNIRWFLSDNPFLTDQSWMVSVGKLMVWRAVWNTIG